jgi:hypothetical protein
VSLSPRAIALQGVGFTPRLVAVQGFGAAEAAAVDWVTANARSYGKARRQVGREYSDAEEMRLSLALARRIEEEDEIALAVVMAAAPILGVSTWHRH